MHIPSLQQIRQHYPWPLRAWWARYRRYILIVSTGAMACFVIYLLTGNGCFRASVDSTTLFPLARGRMWVYRVTQPGLMLPTKAYYRVISADEHGAVVLFNENNFRQQLRWSFQKTAFTEQASLLYFAVHPRYAMPRRLQAQQDFPCALGEAQPGTAIWHGKYRKDTFLGQKVRTIEIECRGEGWQQKSIYLPHVGLLRSQLWLHGQLVRQEDLIRFHKP